MFLWKENIGLSSRSNVATYMKIFDTIREIFAEENSISASEFSFNSTGACPNCNGSGIIKMDMHFLGDVKQVCEICHGKRYNKETLEDGSEREVLKLKPFLAPYKIAVLPLVKKMHGDKANEIFQELSKDFMVSYDESGNIGKRYRRADVVGTPFCITVDDETLNNGTVTLRDRDTMEQITLKVEDVKSYVEDKINF